ncbi:unnamed protein product [Acanthoscelides obtectus]|uniref:Uncharacterized protein n=1 Tax=Acanthoscelides obtectus TaxID=200917 RepID=A0A9P0PJB7_ACAOB|nr:unnamed protein product [Acanthoscelides obtectus]CAK1651688.1 hypothetical protein AOBTE_LOCUS17390 [Acanthoscelides obtectus]
MSGLVHQAQDGLDYMENSDKNKNDVLFTSSWQPLEFIQCDSTYEESKALEDPLLEDFTVSVAGDHDTKIDAEYVEDA